MTTQPPTVALRWLDTNPPTPMPDLLTAEQAIVFLQIAKSKTKNPERTLVHYRTTGKLRGVQIGRAMLYPVQELDRFVRELWREQHPRISFPKSLKEDN